MALTVAQIQAQLDADPGYQNLLKTIPYADRSRPQKIQAYVQSQHPDLWAAMNGLPQTNGNSSGYGVDTTGKVGEGHNTPAWEIAATGAGMGLGAYGLNALMPAAAGAGGVAPLGSETMGTSATGDIAGGASGTDFGLSGAPGVGATGPDLVNGSGLPSGIPSGLAGLLSGKGLGALAGLIPMLAMSGNLGGPGSGGGSVPNVLDNPQLQSLLNSAVGRVKNTDPLQAAISQLAMSRLPTNVQR